MMVKRYLAWSLSLILFLQLTACGTLLYPERRGQPAGNIDVGVVILDGIGLLFFIVPGVIAFATDFATGAIYLPPGRSNITNVKENSASNNPSFQTVQLDPDQLTQERIEQVVYEKTGKSINLNGDNVQAIEVGNDEQLQKLFRSVGTNYEMNKLSS